MILWRPQIIRKVNPLEEIGKERFSSLLIRKRGDNRLQQHRFRCTLKNWINDRPSAYAQSPGKLLTASAG